MELTFWGVRGSFPVARPHVRLFGGNTSCVQLEAEGHHLIIDAGTGIRKLGDRLVANGPQIQPLHLLISHTHWDHILGLPFFSPFFNPKYSFKLYGASGIDANFKTVLHR
ncbi:MAG: MBL fold metallo-hydrolase, partial [Armatimonadetes bacterium]|nr:MBL fold metallo-hydrolase [Armatimonadota bacterium]